MDQSPEPAAPRNKINGNGLQRHCKRQQRLDDWPNVQSSGWYLSLTRNKSTCENKNDWFEDTTPLDAIPSRRRIDVKKLVRTVGTIPPDDWPQRNQ